MATAAADGGVGRPRLWALAGVEAAAFAGKPQSLGSHWPVLRRPVVRGEMWVTLLCCERRVSEFGLSLLMLNPRSGWAWLRVVARLVVLALVVVPMMFLVSAVLFALWQPLVFLPVVALLLVVAPLGWSGFRNRRGRAELKSFGPGRPSVFVHSVARVLTPEAKGAGETVMRALTAEADEKGWRLVLDAGHENLVRYYRQFGFGPIGHPVEMTWGTVERMVRQPGVDHG